MIPKQLDQINEEDLTSLVTAGVSERRTLDYKQQLPDTNDAGKRELLADVSSFANTAGGDLIFGITENAGVPTGVPGIQIGNTDQEILRMDSIIRTGLSPRIRHITRAVSLANGNYVLIIRSEQSWYGPHRVVFKGDSRFWGRTSNGKYELDVTDLRNAFLFASTVTEKIAAFRSERIIALENNRALAPLASGPILVMHCIPLESFGRRTQYDIATLESLHRLLRPLGPGLTGWGVDVNFEGLICLASGDPLSAYTQVYRNGVIEAVRVGVLRASRNPTIIPSLAYERSIVEYLATCFRILTQLGCSAPIFVGLTLIGVRGMTMATANPFGMDRLREIDRDILVLPEVVVEDVSVQRGKLLKPAFDLVWNACGLSASPYFDEDGNWIGQR